MNKSTDLLAQLLVFAQTKLISQQPVHWMFHGLNGTETFVLSGALQGRDQVRRFYTALRLFGLKNNINDYCVISEAWMVRSLTETLEVPVSEHPDRVETLIGVHVKRRNEKRLGKLKIFEIKRTADGRFQSLNREPDLEESGLGGELFKFITPQTPSEADSKAAAAVLKIGQQTMMYPSFDEMSAEEMGRYEKQQREN